MDRARVEKISKALADETRLRIFEAIAARDEMNCGDIVAMHGVTPATVSHHLKTLADAGLIDTRREAQFVFSRVIPSTIEQYAAAISRMVRKKPASTR